MYTIGMRRKGRSTSVMRELFGKALFVLLVVLFGFFSFSLLQEVQRKQAIHDDIARLEDELIKLEGENNQLQSLIDYLKTDEYAELEAKRKLGMKREGEQVILVTQEEDVEPIETAQFVVPTSNWQRWKLYFFTN